MIISAYNPETRELERTYLSQTYPAGTSSFAVRNANNFGNSKAIMIGKQGDERTELLTTSTVTQPFTIATSASSKFGHNTDDPIYLLKYNQIKIYKATSISGIYNLLTTVDIDVDNADGITRYDDTAGVTTSYYKIKFYNSLDTTESDFSDPIAATGNAELSIGKVIDGVARRVRDEQYVILGQQEYLDIANEVNDDLITQAHRPYRFLKDKVVLNTSAGVDYIDIATAVPTFWKFNYLRYAWTTGGVTTTYKIDEPLSVDAFIRKYENSNWADSDQLIDIAIDEDNNRILLGPAPKTSQTGVITLGFYKKFTYIDSLGDLVQTPNSLIYRYKMLAEYYSAKAETDSKWSGLATKYEGKYGTEIVKMQRTNRLDTGTPRSFAPRYVPAYRKRYHL
jgi:hypothetical protein